MIIRPLDRQDIKVGFSCGESDLDAYFAERAWPHARDGVASVFVLQDMGPPQSIVGFYTLSNKSVDAAMLAPLLKRSLPKFPLPVTYVGCFGVASNRQRQGHGATLMGDALARSLAAAAHVGSTGVFLNSRDVRSTAFYKALGFNEVLPPRAEQQAMFLPMSTLRSA